MANFMKHEPCPHCGSKDNLARYSDDSAWCFGCGYYERGRGKTLNAFKAPYTPPTRLVATLPPTMERELLKRGLNASERVLFQYNPSTDRLVWQNGEFREERSFTKTPKVLSYGTKPFVPFGEGPEIVLVEDLFSALRVARVTRSVPLFGSIVTKPWAVMLTKLDRPVILWLDADKYTEAIKQAASLRLLGLDVRVVRTPEDPKAYTPDEVRELLTRF